MKKDIKYTEDFVEDLISEVESKIALISNKDYKNNIYNLGLCNNLDIASDLIAVRDILNKILKCNTCYCDTNIQDVITIAKNKLNAC